MYHALHLYKFNYVYPNLFIAQSFLSSYDMANSPYTNRLDIHTSLHSTSTLPSKIFEVKIHIHYALEFYYPSYRRILQHHESTQTFLFTHKRLLYDPESARLISEELSSMGVSPELIGLTIYRIRRIATEIMRNPSHRGISTIDPILNVSRIFIMSDILEESMQDVPRPIPATEEAIQKLEKVTFQDCSESMRECTICSEEFHQNDLVNQIVRMPCGHVYHQQCIQKWLKISHLCPLCRYKMPCSTSEN